MKQIGDKLSSNSADAGDLFAVADQDGSGKISEEEFRMCTVRLNYQLTDSRVNEIFSKCKKDVKSSELTEQEFKDALAYLKANVAKTSQSMLGKSWPMLMFLLVYLTVML